MKRKLTLSLFISALLLCSQGFSQTSFIKAIFPKKASERVLGKEVLVDKNIGMVKTCQLSDGNDLTFFNYRYESNGISKSGLTFFKSSPTGDSIWTKTIDLGEIYLFESSNIALTPSRNGGVFLSFLTRFDKNYQDILLRISGSGELLWGKKKERIDIYRSIQDNVFEKSNGEVIWTFFDSYIRHDNIPSSFSGISLVRLDSNGNYLDKTSYILRATDGEFRGLNTRMNESDELFVYGPYVNTGVDSLLPAHLESVGIFKVGTNGSVGYGKALYDNQRFRPVDLIAKDSSVIISVTGYYENVLVGLNGNGDTIFTNIYEGDDYSMGALDFHEATLLTATKEGYSLFLPTYDFENDVLLDLSAGLAAPFVRLDINEEGEVIRTEAQGGGGRDVLGSVAPSIASNGISEVQLAYKSYFYEQPIGDYERGINFAKLDPAQNDSGACANQALSTLAHPGAFSVKDLTIEGPYSTAQVVALTGQSFQTPVLPVGLAAMADDSLTIVTLCQGSGNGGSQSFFTDSTTLSPELMSVYPNPVQDKMSLQMNADMGEVVLQVRDLNGKVIVSEKMEGTEGSQVEMGMGEMEAGIYILSIRGKDFFIRKKIIKN